MIVVTGGAGFIGSAIAHELNQQGNQNLLLVDHLGTSNKWKNLVGLEYQDYLEKQSFLELVTKKSSSLQGVKAVFHLGACSSTTEQDASYLMGNNTQYTLALAHWCVQNNIRFIYASSAATYGDGAQGYCDDESKLLSLRPLNMYGYSKHQFDLWAKGRGYFKNIVGLKYFNVFGPNEYHKGDMRSMVVKAFLQIKQTGKVQLFKSHRPDFDHGKQQRDFVYIKDAVRMTLHFLNPGIPGGVYNVGTGQARSWVDMMQAIYSALNLPPNIEFIDMPKILQDKYQYFTQADMAKTLSTGYSHPPLSLEKAIEDYVRYLNNDFATLST